MLRQLQMVALAIALATLLVSAGCARHRAGASASEALLVLKCQPLEEGAAITDRDVAKTVEILGQRVGEDGLVDEGEEESTIRLGYDDEAMTHRELEFLIGVGELEIALVPEHYEPVVAGNEISDCLWQDRRGAEEVEWEVVYEASEVPFTRDDLMRNSQVQEVVFARDDHMPNSQVQERSGRDQWDVSFEIADEKQEDFRAVTGANVGRILALVLDGKPLMAPVIRSAIPGRGVISGDFTEHEAAIISRVLNTDPLPVRLSIIEPGAAG